MSKTPPAEVVKWTRRRRWDEELITRAEKVAGQHAELGIDLKIAEEIFLSRQKSAAIEKLLQQ